MAPLHRIFVFCLAFLAMLVPPTLAHAEPSLPDIEKEINATWEKLEPVIEQYNKVHADLQASQAKAAELQKQIDPMEATVALNRGRIGALAAQYYMGGRTSFLNALLSAGSASNLADQLTLLDETAQSGKRTISETIEAKSKLDGEKAELQKVIEAQGAQDLELANRKKAIDAEMDRLQKLRLQAYGNNAPGGSLKKGPCPALAIGGKAGIAVDFACRQIGKPYKYATSGPNTYDCSGLTAAAWEAAGVSLTHYSGAQWKEGTRIASADARPGDLVFFFSDLHHVAVYVGSGLMVHAPHTGDVVRMEYIKVMPVMGFVRPG